MSGRCFYCDTPVFKNNEKDNMETRDHILPLGLGGGGYAWANPNIVRACRKCNNEKGDMHPRDWYHLIKDPECQKAFAEKLYELFPMDKERIREELGIPHIAGVTCTVTENTAP